MGDVTLTNVGKTYPGGVEAVRDFGLEVASGELIVCVGPSGCGKSSVLRMIAGLESITTGEIRIAGRVVNDLPPKDRDIAMVFQNYALYPHMTVAGNMGFALRMRRVRRDEIARRVAAAARMLGIEELLDRRPKALSGGQQQRVALGRAMVREPAAFLFDEPLSNLDAKLRVTTRAEIKSLQRRIRTTTIYVTHDQEEAMSLGDRVVVMCDGRIQHVGTPLEVYRTPRNRFVASFIGSPAMNFIEGSIEADDGHPTFVETRVSSDERVRLPVPASWTAAVTDHRERPVALGIRPSAFSDRPIPSGLSIPVRVELVEHLGDVSDVVCATRNHPHLLARVPARDDFPVDGELTLSVAPESLHLFEAGPLGARIA